MSDEGSVKCPFCKQSYYLSDLTALQAECERLKADKRELVEAMEKALFSQTVGELYDVLKAAIAKHKGEV